MPAYVIVETDVTDPEQYERYKAAASAAVAASGGRYLVRGGELAVFEGDWQPSRLVVLEFEDLAAARSWYASARDQEAKGLRQGRHGCGWWPCRASTKEAVVPGHVALASAELDQIQPTRPQDGWVQGTATA